MTVGSGVLAACTNKYGSQYEIVLYDPATFTLTRLTTNTSYDHWWPRISPDRTKILYYRTPVGVLDTDPTKNTLRYMNADGSSDTEILAVGAHSWAQNGHAEWWPDGTKIVVCGGVSTPQIYTINTSGTILATITSQQYGATDPSPNPDGTTIAFAGVPNNGTDDTPHHEVITISTSTGTKVRVTSDTYAQYDPYISPDSSTVVWLANMDPLANSGNGQWSLYKRPADGSGTPAAVIDDGNINSRGVWDSTGTYLYFHRYPWSTAVWNIWKIKPDGTGIAQVTNDGTHNYMYPST